VATRQFIAVPGTFPVRARRCSTCLGSLGTHLSGMETTNAQRDVIEHPVHVGAGPPACGSASRPSTTCAARVEGLAASGSVASCGSGSGWSTLGSPGCRRATPNATNREDHTRDRRPPAHGHRHLWRRVRDAPFGPLDGHGVGWSESCGSGRASQQLTSLSWLRASSEHGSRVCTGFVDAEPSRTSAAHQLTSFQISGRRVASSAPTSLNRVTARFRCVIASSSLPTAWWRSARLFSRAASRCRSP